MLFPRENRFRLANDIGGYWSFRPDPQRTGHAERWFASDSENGAMTIVVPGAWNEQLAERGIMNFVGLGWYHHEVILPEHATRDQRIWLRVGAADHRADVWLNGVQVGSHDGGYMPFECELTRAWKPGQTNRLVVAVDSALTMHSLPQGVDPKTPPYDGKSYERRHVFPPTRFDFFPYGGITRSVYLVTTPKDRIADITIAAAIDGTLEVSAKVDGSGHCSVSIIDDSGTIVGEAQLGLGNSGRLTVSKPRLWSPAHPHRYVARIRLHDSGNTVVDEYDQPFGFREIRVNGDRLLLNNEPLFLTGFGKHEDFPIVGRGTFRPGFLRDFELMRWVGANSFRTSHYPYDEEIMNLADELGFLVIDEVPAVSLGFWSERFEDLDPLLKTHQRFLSELIARDKNHPSVISWSIVNEPNLWSEPQYQNDASSRYFKEVAAHVKTLDPSRPVMSVTIPAFSENDVSLDACDLIGINRYYAWYTDPAEIDKATRLLDEELDRIHRKHRKPIVMTEFGVDTIEGYHATTPQMFTEEFQIAFLRAYCDVLDNKPYCAGTHIWNFADFLTPQHHRRVVLNKKGLFTRTRQPKSAAFAIRERWLKHPRIVPAHRPAIPSDSFLIADRYGSQ